LNTIDFVQTIDTLKLVGNFHRVCDHQQRYVFLVAGSSDQVDHLLLVGRIDVGSWFAPEFKDERVPTLAEVLDTCKGKASVNIELKYYGHDEQLEQRVADIVEAHGMTSDVVLMALKVDAVEKMKSIRPDWKVGLLMSVSAGDLENLDADFLAINAGFANRGFIRSAHEMDREVYLWTVNDAPTMSTMIGRGVDSLITDKPALARSVLEQRAKLSAPERLLLELAGMLGVVPEVGEQ
jgi:glycerophosphoryl diester phosphodiesterase